MADAGGDRRRAVGHPVRPLTYQRRTIAPTAWSAFAPTVRRRSEFFWTISTWRSPLRAAHVLARVGWMIRDGVLNVVSAWTLEAGDRLRRTQTGKVQDYVWAVGLGLLALMAWIGVAW
jgi:hypothetical protein